MAGIRRSDRAAELSCVIGNLDVLALNSRFCPSASML